MSPIPTVARILHYFPAAHDTFMTRRMGTGPSDTPLPLAAIVVDVISDNLVNVTVFDAFGKPHSRVHVPVIDEAHPYMAERCREGYVAWPVMVRPAENVARTEPNNPARLGAFDTSNQAGSVGVAQGAGQKSE